LANTSKSEDILNELSRQYNIDGINDKNIEAQNTEISLITD
jgi:hypothetical protein